MDSTQADLFISYSRRDIETVKRLSGFLECHECRVWIDLEGIAPTAKWLHEIQSAIEHAHSFLFVLSSNSLASEACGLELAHAIENRKRLIPVLLEDIPDDKVPADLAEVQWVFMRPQDDFNAALDKLLTAINTDLDMVKALTRIQVRALEWQADEEKSRLLRGKDLAEAEKWIADGADSKLKATALQSRYLLASRNAETRRSRTMLASVSTALAIAVVLAVFAWIQRDRAIANEAEAKRQTIEADNQRKTAVANAEEAERRRQQAERENLVALINGSSSSLESGRQLEAQVAALAAAVKLQREPELARGTLNWHRTISTLRRALYGTRERNRIKGDHFRGVTDLAFSPGEDELFLAGGGGAISRWSAGGVPGGRFETGMSGEADGCTSFARLAVGPDEIVTVGLAGEVGRWKYDGTPLDSFWASVEGGGGYCGPVEDARVDFANRTITLYSSSGSTVVSMDGTAGVRAAPGSGAAGRNEPVISPDGQYVAQNSRWIPEENRWGPVVVSSRSGTELLRLQGQRQVAFRHQAGQVATIDADVDTTIVHIWDINPPSAPEYMEPTAEPAVPEDITLGDNRVKMLPNGHFDDRMGVFSADRRHAAICTDSYGMTTEIWRLPESGAAGTPELVSSFQNEQIASADFSRALSGMTFSSDGQLLATGGTDGTVKIWTLDGNLLRTIVAHRSYASAAFSPDGLLLVTGGEMYDGDGGAIKLWSIDGELLESMSVAAHDPHFDPDGKLIVASVGSLFSGEAGKLVWPNELDWLIEKTCGAIGDYLANGPVEASQRDLCK